MFTIGYKTKAIFIVADLEYTAAFLKPCSTEPFGSASRFKNKNSHWKTFVIK